MGLPTLQDVQASVVRQNKIGKGYEGVVYKLGEYAVKVNRRGREGIDNLTFFQRQAVHQTINALSGDSVVVRKNQQLFSTKLVDILACHFLNAEQSAAVMPLIEGKPSSEPADQDSYKAFQAYGVSIDNHGRNIMWLPEGDESRYDMITLETSGVVHPDIFKQMEWEDDRCVRAAMDPLAKAYLLGAGYPYPTLHLSMVNEVRNPLLWEDIHQITTELRTSAIDASNASDLRHQLHQQRTSHELQNLKSHRSEISQLLRSIMGKTVCRFLDSLERMRARWISGGSQVIKRAWDRHVIPALAQAKQTFGEQFQLEEFDWANGTNLKNFSIRDSLFHLFRTRVDAHTKEIEELLEEADRQPAPR